MTVDAEPRAASAQAPPTHPLQVQLGFACRVLSHHGHDDFNQGQASTRLPGGARFWIKRAVCGFDQAVPADMVLCAVDPADPPPADAPPELPLHQAIYGARPDVNAIVHTHAESATVFGATDLCLAPLSHEGAYFSEGIPRFDRTSQTVLERDVAAAIAQALGDRAAVFLCNHGVVVVGKTIRQATVLALMLERACRMQLLAESLRLPYRVSRADELDAKRRFIYSDVALKSYWDHSVASVRRRDADTREWAVR